MGVSGQRHAPATPGTPGTHWLGGWVCLRAGLDAGAGRKILCPCRGSNPDRPARSQDTILPELPIPLAFITVYLHQKCSSFQPSRIPCLATDCIHGVFIQN
jgi:hypothetical protein